MTVAESLGIQRVFGQKKRRPIASTSDCSCLCPCLLMSFL